MRTKTKRVLASLLAVILVITAGGGIVSADAEQNTYAEGLCEHHPEHTEGCGYQEASEGSPCTHEHTEDCYTQDENGETVLDCQHVHDEDCGYQEPSEGNPCTYSCDICNGEEDADTSNLLEETDETLVLEEEKEISEIPIADWSWVDEDEILQKNGESWGLGLPGVNESNPVMQEDLKELLPSQIRAQIPLTEEKNQEQNAREEKQKTEEKILDISWDLSVIPEEGIWSGEYAVNAELPEGYQLAEGTEDLCVTVQLGGAETYFELPSGKSTDAPFPGNRVDDTVSPKGTTINLFDYWQTEQTSADIKNPPKKDGTLTHKNFPWMTKKGSVPSVQDYGINAEHSLLFSAELGSNFGAWNTWTGNDKPHQGIIKNTLVNGYPQLNDLNTDDAEYTEGNYYYKTLNGRDGKGSLEYLFNPLLKTEGKASYEDVQNLLQVDESGYYYYDATRNYATYYPEDNSFAVYKKPAVDSGGGGTGGSHGEGQFFPFNEADEVFTEDWWTGEPVKNGITSGSDKLNHYFGVTMSTRFVQQYGGHTEEQGGEAVTYEFSGDDDVWVFIDDVLVADLGGIHNRSSLSIDFSTGEVSVGNNTENTTLKEKFLEAGRYGTTSWDGNTFADNTFHTLNFFYLERGGVDSNMSLKFNLVTIPESSLIKVDQAGDPVPNAEFTLYAPDGKTEIAKGTTDKKGEFVFVDEKGFILSIQQIYEKYYDEGDLILRETRVPDGYRSSGDMKLYFYKGNAEKQDILLLSRNHWETGAYAMSKVTASAPEQIQIYNTDGTWADTRSPADAGVMFAVVMQKKNGSWYPVYGDPLKGWNVIKDMSWDSVKTAASKSPYLFELSSSGAYQVTVNNLPGNVKNYYFFVGNEKDAEYTVSYYYSEAKSISDVNGSNTYLMNPRDKENQLARVFSVDLYVPNIRNNLYVQKVDDEGKALTDKAGSASFALYEEKDVTVKEDGSYEIHPGASAYMEADTADMEKPFKMEDGVLFSKINKGTYYLIETKAPSGYKINSTPVKIVVDNSGVYADAGDKEDGISVERGVGSVVHSMVQFAEDDDVDATLHDIRADLYTSDNYGGEWNQTDQSLHLQYSAEEKVLEYGPAFPGDPVSFTVDSGWSKLGIHQCLSHSEITSPKQDLIKEEGDPDLVNLFSGTVTVQVQDERIGELEISKTVTGEEAPADAKFTFALGLTDKEGKALTGEYSAVKTTVSSGTETISVKDGDELSLKGGEKLLITDLPIGAGYTVEETEIPLGFTPSVQINSSEKQDGVKAEGTIPHGRETVAYTNDYSKDVILTGESALKGRKTLTGRNLTEKDNFDFELSAKDDTTKQAVADGQITFSGNGHMASVTGDGSENTKDFAFGAITFKQKGSYSFSIKEKLPDGVTAENPTKDHMTYDTHETTVSVTVTEQPQTQLLTAAVSYDNSQAPVSSDQTVKDAAAFTNRITADLSFQKVRKGEDTENDLMPLSGAKFGLYRQICKHDHGKDLVEINRNEDGTTDGSVAESGKECWELVKVIRSDGDGNVIFKNLPIEDTYRLIEIETPGGYTLPTGQWIPSYDEKQQSFVFKEGESSVGNPPAVGIKDDGTYYIINYKPGEIPFTGNIGILKFLAIGGVLMAAGGTGLLWNIRRKRKMNRIHKN